MSSLNQATLIGNVGNDPEIRNLPNGGKVANFSLATSEKWKDKNTGETKERTEWHRIVVWNEGLIGVIERYVEKGHKLMVQGQIQTEKYEKDGQDRYATKIVLTGFDAKLVMLSGGQGGNRDPNDNASRPGNSASSGRPQSNAPAFEPGGMGGGFDADIPFAPEVR